VAADPENPKALNSNLAAFIWKVAS